MTKNNKSNPVTREDIFDDSALNFGKEYADNIQKAIDANERFMKQTKRMTQEEIKAMAQQEVELHIERIKKYASSRHAIKNESFKQALVVYKHELDSGRQIKTTAELIKSADEIAKWITSEEKLKKTPIDSHIELLTAQSKNDRNNDDYKAFCKKLIIILEDLKQKESL